MNHQKNIRIELKNVSKTFLADLKKEKSILAHVVDLVTGKSCKKEIPILSNLSLEVRAGEILGIIGRNGSGKSTLLRLIAGIYEQDVGEISTNGKIVYLTGLGQGLSPKLTMRENIYLMGSVMGLSQKDVKRKFKEIVEFSGLKEYADMKVYQFSNGMVARLNFSVMIHCVNHHSPEILLLDEVFSAGGDLDFQKKATKKMEDLIRGDATVLLVSHDLENIKKYCHRTLLLKKDGSYVLDQTDIVLKQYR